jgi:hypothetical protein
MATSGEVDPAARRGLLGADAVALDGVEDAFGGDR